MIPAVPVPRSAWIKVPVEIKLKPQYRYDAGKRVFVSEKGERFRPDGALPKGTRIVYKVPALAEADPRKLSASERDLQRYMQVILPQGEAAADYLEIVRAWPSVEDAWVAPEVSLPGAR
jgi:hypothetical protein